MSPRAVSARWPYWKIIKLTLQRNAYFDQNYCVLQSKIGSGPKVIPFLRACVGVCADGSEAFRVGVVCIFEEELQGFLRKNLTCYFVCKLVYS